MTPLSLQMTVGEVATTLPGAVELFRRAGISYCCGGGATLAQAAPGAGLTPEALLAALTALVEAAGRAAPEATPELIDHIRHRYHDTHREELDWLIPLAQKVERVHGDHEDAPLGLTEALIALQGELDAHMRKEEDILFPVMRAGGAQMIAHPIAQMRHEHDEVASLMAAVNRATHGLALPDGACGSWTALYVGLDKFTEDLVAHVHLENEVLFPRFEPVAMLA